MCDVVLRAGSVLQSSASYALIRGLSLTIPLGSVRLRRCWVACSACGTCRQSSSVTQSYGTAVQAARNYRRTLRRILLYTTAATAVGGAVYFGYRFFESQQASAEASASEHKQPPAAIADH